MEYVLTGIRALLVLFAVYIILVLIVRLYIELFIHPLMRAWAPYSKEWLSWRQIKRHSNGRSIHVLFMLHNLEPDEYFEIRVRQDVGIGILEKSYGPILSLDSSLKAPVFYEFRILPKSRRIKRRKKLRKVPLRLGLPGLVPAY